MTTPSETAFPTFSEEPEEVGNPLESSRTDHFVKDITRGGESLAQRLSADISEVSIRRAMQIGYILCCQDNGLPTPEMPDPAVEKGFA